MRITTKIISVALLAGALSITAVGCGTKGDQSNVSSSSQSSTQEDILSQDPKEVYQKVEDKMQSINSYSMQMEMSAAKEGDSQATKSNTSMDFEDFHSDNPKGKSVVQMNIGNNNVEVTMYFLDGYKYISANQFQDDQAFNIKSPMTEEDKKAFKPVQISSDELATLKLEKDSEGRTVIVSELTQGVKDNFKQSFGDVEITEGDQRITIDSDYKIIGFEVSAKSGSNGGLTMNTKVTYSYEPVKIEFPSFEGYIEGNI